MEPLKGFTLIELMVCMAVLSTLVLLGFYSFFSTMNSRKLSYAGRRIYSAVATAKFEAVKHGKDVKISFHPNDESFEITDDSSKVLTRFKFDDGVNIFQSINSSSKKFSFTFDSRGLKKGVNGSVGLCLGSIGDSSEFKRVRVTTAGGISIQRSENGITWE